MKGVSMIFKSKRKTPLKTAKPIMAKPIVVNNKTVIPIHYIDVEVYDLKFPNLFGSIESKGAIIVEDEDIRFISLDTMMNLNDLMQSIPELKETLGKTK